MHMCRHSVLICFMLAMFTFIYNHFSYCMQWSKYPFSALESSHQEPIPFHDVTNHLTELTKITNSNWHTVLTSRRDTNRQRVVLIVRTETKNDWYIFFNYVLMYVCFIYVYMYVCIMYVCVYICINECMYVRMYIFIIIYVCMSVCLYLSMYVYVYF